ncbi:MAG: Rrf2 family transcriptional regulator [Lachnospiraceae bacterium]|nr:Rrf2 family transcriptional regulator [Lachnospiraceae bacterium]
MKVSTRVEYGLIALTDIVIHSEKGGSVSAPEIAQRQNISHKYLEHILLLLRQAGFIVAQKGLRGGYLLTRSPEEIKLADVLNALDSNILADVDDKKEEGELRSIINERFWDRINDNLNRFTKELNMRDFADGCLSCFSDAWDLYVI